MNEKLVESSKLSEVVEPSNDEILSDSIESNVPSDEETLLECVKYVLKHHGLERSVASIREMADATEEEFNYKTAVSTFRNFDFSANVGSLKLRKLDQGHCPAIIRMTSGRSAVLVEVKPKKEVTLLVASEDKTLQVKTYPYSEFKGLYTADILLVKSPKNKVQDKKNKKVDWFWSSMKQSKWTYSQVIMAAAVSNFLGLSTSIFIMVVYDSIVPNQAIESLVALTVGVLIALFFDFLIKSLRASFIDRAGKTADERMSRLIFNQLMSINLASKNAKSGALASVVREFESLREFFTSATLVAVVDLPFIFLFIYVCYLIGGPLALIPLVCVPVVIFLGLFVQPFLAKLSVEAMSIGMSKQGVLVETLQGIETIKATGSQNLMKKRFQEATVQQSETGQKSRMFTHFAINSTTSVQQLAQIGIIFYGVFLIQDGIVTMGSLIATVILAGRTLAPLSQLANALTRLNSARTAFKTINDLMSKPVDRGENDNLLSRPILEGDIEFRNVSFRYPGATSNTITDLNFVIKKGEKVIIMGKMGSGKSTIARLLTGLYEPDEGSILIDGVDIRQIDRADFRRNVGFMLQDTWLFSGSIKENIQMGFIEYTDDKILEIAKISGVDEFVRQNPAGFDFQLKERGEGLSGGQRQSINLARALLHSPNTLILDEPTSSMDAATEKMVLTNLSENLDGKTLVAISHRNSLVRLASRVLIIDGGVLIADDSPEKLAKAV
jgi:ATP-binding cassette subfamily C protein LapB